VFHIASLLLMVFVVVTWGPAVAQSPHMASASWKGSSALPAVVAVVYRQPPNPLGGLWQSSLRDPNGSDTDQWAWDGFKLSWTQDIAEVQWRGGYDPVRLGSGGPVVAFSLTIYASIPSGLQPDMSVPPLARFDLAGNAGETVSEVLGGVQTYDYHYVLPTPFQAVAQTKYWLQIEAFQGGAPDWGLAKATGGEGWYFRRLAGDGFNYQVVAGDTAFALLGPLLHEYRLYLPLVAGPAGLATLMEVDATPANAMLR
jgi:hypothetical protein